MLRQVELIYDATTLGKNWTEQPVRAEMQDAVATARRALVEGAVEHDDVLMERYLEGEEISEAELRHAIRNATIAGAMTPVLTGSAFKNKGVQQLLDSVIDYLPVAARHPGHQGDRAAERGERPGAPRLRRRALLGAGVQDRDRPVRR